MPDEILPHLDYELFRRTGNLYIRKTNLERVQVKRRVTREFIESGVSSRIIGALPSIVPADKASEADATELIYNAKLKEYVSSVRELVGEYHSAGEKRRRRMNGRRRGGIGVHDTDQRSIIRRSGLCRVVT